MIEKYYTSHIKTSLDAAAINIRKKNRRRKRRPRLNLMKKISGYTEVVLSGRGEIGRRTGLKRKP